MSQLPSRRQVLFAGAMLCGHSAVLAQTAPATVQSANERLQRYTAVFRPTAVMVSRDGALLASAGEVKQKVNLRSVRKSLLSAMFGAVMDEFRIDLDATLADLGIDDQPQLSPEERRATLRMLLQARSGVFHDAAYETADMKHKRPRRGSHPPGNFWYYNNWDFNALGTIYSKLTGEQIFESFERRIARPLGMLDFSVGDGGLIYEKVSIHPAYPFRMSARDALVFGEMILRRGMANGRQIVPARWIDVSSQVYSQTDRPGRGYGYLWWILPPATFGEGAVLASGNGGQYIAVIRQKQLVAVQTTASDNLRTQDFLNFVSEIAEA